MPILKLGAHSNTASEKLDDWGTVGLPLSEPACRLRGSKIVAPIANAPEIGVWECSPGRYRREIRSAETMHVLSGDATFTPDGGEPVALGAGDLYFFPPDTMGVWDIKNTLRKAYVLFKGG
ncbi:MAG: cupin domain-containing protein [Rhodoferax sp.]